jgi:hypothetical protein
MLTTSAFFASPPLARVLAQRPAGHTRAPFRRSPPSRLRRCQTIIEIEQGILARAPHRIQPGKEDKEGGEQATPQAPTFLITL